MITKSNNGKLVEGHQERKIEKNLLSLSLSGSGGLGGRTTSSPKKSDVVTPSLKRSACTEIEEDITVRKRINLTSPGVANQRLFPSVPQCGVGGLGEFNGYMGEFYGQVSQGGSQGYYSVYALQNSSEDWNFIPVRTEETTIGFSEKDRENVGLGDKLEIEEPVKYRAGAIKVKKKKAFNCSDLLDELRRKKRAKEYEDIKTCIRKVLIEENIEEKEEIVLRIELSFALIRLGEYGEAGVVAEEGLKIMGGTGGQIAELNLYLANACLARKDYEGAEKAAKAGIDVKRKRDGLTAALFNSHGVALWNQGKDFEAEVALLVAKKFASRDENLENLLSIYKNLCMLRLRQRNYVELAEFAFEGLGVLRCSGVRRAEFCKLLSMAYLEQGYFEKAEDTAIEGLKECNKQQSVGLRKNLYAARSHQGKNPKTGEKMLDEEEGYIA